MFAWPIYTRDFITQLYETQIAPHDVHGFKNPLQDLTIPLACAITIWLPNGDV